MFNERFVLDNIRRSLMQVKNRVYNKICDLDMEVYKSKEPIPFENRTSGDYAKVDIITTKTIQFNYPISLTS